MGSEVPEGLEPCCPRRMDGQGSVGPVRPPADPLPVCTPAQRPGVAARKQRRAPSPGERGAPERRRSRRVRGESSQESEAPAGSAALAGEVAEPRAFKAALTFLGIGLANGRRPGRKREGGQSGFLSPPPAAPSTAFQLESEGGGGGRVRRALELLRKRCLPTRPWRTPAQHFRSCATKA